LGHIPANCRGQTWPWSRCELGQGEESRRRFLHPPTSWNRFTNKPNRRRICDTNVLDRFSPPNHNNVFHVFWATHSCSLKVHYSSEELTVLYHGWSAKTPPGFQARIWTRDLTWGRQARYINLAKPHLFLPVAQQRSFLLQQQTKKKIQVQKNNSW
jgi:hypothetical protein